MATRGTLRRARLFALAPLSLAACATMSAPLTPALLQTDSVSEIVTGGIREGRLVLVDGCLYLQAAQWRYVAFFREGTVLADDGEALILPDGQPIVTGRTYPFVLEYYPTLRNANAACEGHNAIVRAIDRGDMR